MRKKALAIISFGTTYPDARRAIDQLETAISASQPTYDCFRAFTSGMVRDRIMQKEGERVPSPEALLQQLCAQGYDEIVCQSLHVIPGIEYDKMCAQLHRICPGLAIGKPLLSAQSDYEAVCQVLEQELPILSQTEAYVFMGHGTEHFANAAYSQLENTMRARGHERIYVGTVEGFPDLAYVIQRLKVAHVKQVHLAPFMIVAGDHAQNDLAGEEDSWKTTLEAAGFKTVTHLRGLGELEGIAQIYIRHCAEALNALS